MTPPNCTARYRCLSCGRIIDREPGDTLPEGNERCSHQWEECTTDCPVCGEPNDLAQDEVERLRKVNAELVAACEAMANNLQGFHLQGIQFGSVLTANERAALGMARAAIAKAKESAS